jgi:hypothetical protein
MVRGAPFLLLAMMVSAEARETPVTCVNPASGATWQIRIDYDRHTVDAFEARISATEILWKDSGGDNYTLNRKSGELTQITPSSTGGYFLHDRCKLG